MKLRRLLVFTGTSGAEIAAVAGFVAEKLGLEHVKYEDYVEDYMRAPIYHVAELLLADYRQVSAKMLKAFETVLDSVGGEEEVVISAHLVYYRRLNTVFSPLVLRLLELSRSGVEVSVVDYVDDYYHVLYRIATRVAEGVTPGVASFQPLDPAGLITWRTTIHSLAQLLDGSGIRVALYASKHTGEGHIRLAAMLLGRRAENGRRYEAVYVSHPISKVRDRAAREGVPLWSYPDAVEIEEFKETLEKECPHIVVYSPTTIDELIPGTSGGLTVRVRREDRWPHPENGIHSYPYPVDLASELFNNHLYPVKTTVENPGYLYFLQTQVQASIERRDLGYVSQADLLVAYRPTMYGEHHMGVETEIKTAIAMGKPVYSLVAPGEKPPYTLFRFEYPVNSLDELLRLLRCR